MGLDEGKKGLKVGKGYGLMRVGVSYGKGVRF